MEILGYLFLGSDLQILFLDTGLQIFFFNKFSSDYSSAKPKGRRGKYIKNVGIDKNPCFSNHCPLLESNLNIYDF